MKKLISSLGRLSSLLLVVAMIIAAISSCRELSHDGLLTGQWQITSIEHPDGSVSGTGLTNFYCFYRNVAQLTNNNTTRVSANMIYDKNAATITLHFPYDQLANLAQWGLTADDSEAAVNDIADPTDAQLRTTTIRITTLTSSRLTLHTPTGTTITLRKF